MFFVEFVDSFGLAVCGSKTRKNSAQILLFRIVLPVELSEQI